MAWISQTHCVGGSAPDIFPLRIAPNGRSLQQADGTPFLLVGDTPWTPEVNLTNAQIDTYLNNRQALGFNTIMFELVEHQFTTTPPQNVDGAVPFSSAGNFSTASGVYWDRVVYIVAQAKARGMLCIIFPAYFGFSGTAEGWISEITADTAGHLQSYGAFLATLLAPYRNYMMAQLGDYVPTSTERDKQANIITGARSVTTTDLYTGHASRGNTAYATLSVYPEFLSNGVNTIYYGTPNAADAQAAIAMAVSPAKPFFTIEDVYENDPGVTAVMVRTSVYSSLLSGAVGHLSSVSQLWPFGTSTGSGDGLGAAHALATFLNTTGTQQRIYAFKLFQSVTWWLGVPKIDASVVTGPLGTTGTAARICPMISSDGTWALIWKNNTSSITVKMASFSKTMRLRWFDPTNNTFTLVGTFANTVDQVFTHPGNNSAGVDDWVLMAD